MVAARGGCRHRHYVIKMPVQAGVLFCRPMRSSKVPFFVLEELPRINVQRTLEQSELVGLTEQARPNEGSVPTANDIKHTIDPSGVVLRLDINFADFPDERREALQTMLVRTRNTIAAQTNLIARSTINGVTNKMVHAALGMRDAVNPSKTQGHGSYGESARTRGRPVPPEAEFDLPPHVGDSVVEGHNRQARRWVARLFDGEGRIEQPYRAPAEALAGTPEFAAEGSFQSGRVG